MKKSFLLLFFVNIFARSYAQQHLYELNAVSFFKLQEVNSPIIPSNPDYELLDAAIFQATNEQRLKFGLNPFIFSASLYQASSGHSEDMIRQDFYGHDNPYTLSKKHFYDRVFLQKGEFAEMAENIAQQDFLNISGRFCYTPATAGRDFVFYNCDTGRIIPVLTYLELARTVVAGWMDSKPHRKNILNPKLQYIGCSGRLCRNPLKSALSHFGRFTQDFGGRL
ncbi:Uncharacterized conserved protein YkwD, contains CAP (CSP/antigen 5/PR1) domain [Pseudarcicella hirudinis]|uniref:Uncharacterized conserved protein YkwD, contains CAP (CSP/antigen 5/PR1) domain n=1 Tax=Pseudarcicella hirudinis TaxID=1079859 RepID=A0A1I5MG34_9BACT|nr:CAP domain-containing protein [Pseudarcicella hirudinis]SFP08598.1 Uncharacterized conserved protein YkwD, contains CAP (CSP/antigen 5/PR1) domain [Pseudarcicella hirudinis]